MTISCLCISNKHVRIYIKKNLFNNNNFLQIFLKLIISNGKMQRMLNFISKNYQNRQVILNNY